MQFLKFFLGMAFVIFFVFSLNRAHAISGIVGASKNIISISSKKVIRPYEALVQKLATKYKVPIDLAHAVINVESSYKVFSKGAAGEIGLMQIKPSTARWLGFNGSVQDLYDPRTNLEYGIRYLAKAYKLSSGNTCRTILKYNAGHAAKKMNSISAKYCSKVKIYLASLK
ncbi:lytic transglycosylase domain-containing protein [Bartonella sp. F02]|uniref:lytic transglycosylase domain-containing protein n=1 Tax=Bartonella sp. F02 TaxID=2967262 RepID=UPI0022A8D313|nr:transglycosylase SLT domain-containing protein [Bartonella sp. F02]MCZ2328675.1 transglycosylase SLT domain-containing protein [Bartonella sp. F02]